MRNPSESTTAQDWQKPFSAAEIDAARRATRDEAGILADVLALMRRIALNLPFSEDVLAASYCVMDRNTAPRVKLILLAALAYFVMPLDAVPDFIPLLGYGDDAAVLAGAIATVRGAILPEHRSRARKTLDGLSPSA